VTQREIAEWEAHARSRVVSLGEYVAYEARLSHDFETVSGDSGAQRDYATGLEESIGTELKQHDLFAYTSVIRLHAGSIVATGLLFAHDKAQSGGALSMFLDLQSRANSSSSQLMQHPLTSRLVEIKLYTPPTEEPVAAATEEIPIIPIAAGAGGGVLVGVAIGLAVWARRRKQRGKVADSSAAAKAEDVEAKGEKGEDKEGVDDTAHAGDGEPLAKDKDTPPTSERQATEPSPSRLPAFAAPPLPLPAAAARVEVAPGVQIVTGQGGEIQINGSRDDQRVRALPTALPPVVARHEVAPGVRIVTGEGTEWVGRSRGREGIDGAALVASLLGSRSDGPDTAASAADTPDVVGSALMSGDGAVFLRKKVVRDKSRSKLVVREEGEEDSAVEATRAPVAAKLPPITDNKLPPIEAKPHRKKRQPRRKHRSDTTDDNAEAPTQVEPAESGQTESAVVEGGQAEGGEVESKAESAEGAAGESQAAAPKKRRPRRKARLQPLPPQSPQQS